MFFGDTTTLFAIHHGKSSCQLTKTIKLDQYGYELKNYIQQTFREQGTFDIFKMRGRQNKNVQSYFLLWMSP